MTARSGVIWFPFVSDKNTTGLKKEWGGQRIHQAQDIDLVMFEPAFTQSLAETIDRQNHWMVMVTDGYLNVGCNEKSFDCQLEKLAVADFTG